MVHETWVSQMWYSCPSVAKHDTDTYSKYQLWSSVLTAVEQRNLIDKVWKLQSMDRVREHFSIIFCFVLFCLIFNKTIIVSSPATWLPSHVLLDKFTVPSIFSPVELALNSNQNMFGYTYTFMPLVQTCAYFVMLVIIVGYSVRSLVILLIFGGVVCLFYFILFPSHLHRTFWYWKSWQVRKKLLANTNLVSPCYVF